VTIRKKTRNWMELKIMEIGHSNIAVYAMNFRDGPALNQQRRHVNREYRPGIRPFALRDNCSFMCLYNFFVRYNPNPVDGSLLVPFLVDFVKRSNRLSAFDGLKPMPLSIMEIFKRSCWPSAWIVI